MDVLRPGTKCLIDKSAAMVRQVSISANDHVMYELVWWKGGDRVAQWVEEFEVELADYSSTMTIGFAT